MNFLAIATLAASRVGPCGAAIASNARLAAAIAAGAVLAVLLASCASNSEPSPLLIAPMVQGVELCELPAGTEPLASESKLASACRALGLTAASLIESGLAALDGGNRDPSLPLGYTLPIPLLKLYIRGGKGWEIDRGAVERYAATVREVPRPVVLHLFSTHFAAGALLEADLAEHPENVAHAATGPMPKDRFMGWDVYPWTVAATDNGITRFRSAAIDAVLAAMCRLPERDRRKIRAVTVLGEVHQFHADFERGMGLGGEYVVSDYSNASKVGFAQFLAERFGTIERLNAAIGASFGSFDEVLPPDSDVRRQAGLPVLRHIDSAAAGKLPLTGWVFEGGLRAVGPVWIRIYRDGELVARVPARYGRQDVAQAKPEFGTADVGWRYDMDFTTLAPGGYRLDFVVERSDGSLSVLGSRTVFFADDPRARSSTVAGSTPAVQAADRAGEVEGSIDYPPDGEVFFFNRLVPLWHEFRGLQVVRYLEHFDRLVRTSCLADTAYYTHQIAPFVNPGWDASKFAADASLRRAGRLRLGISLYGEATYGHSFFDWLATTDHGQYGVTEFHPLKAMTAEQLRAVFERHRERGATFLSFFMDVRPSGFREAASSNPFAFDPSNPAFGSDALYHAVRGALAASVRPR